MACWSPFIIPLEHTFPHHRKAHTCCLFEMIPSHFHIPLVSSSNWLLPIKQNFHLQNSMHCLWCYRCFLGNNPKTSYDPNDDHSLSWKLFIKVTVCFQYYFISHYFKAIFFLLFAISLMSKNMKVCWKALFYWWKIYQVLLHGSQAISSFSIKWTGTGVKMRVQSLLAATYHVALLIYTCWQNWTGRVRTSIKTSSDL